MALNASPSSRNSSLPVIETRSSMRPSAMARVTFVSAKMRVMNDRPQNQPSTTVPEQRERDRGEQLPLEGAGRSRRRRLWAARR